jgi:hypothetical protein
VAPWLRTYKLAQVLAIRQESTDKKIKQEAVFVFLPSSGPDYEVFSPDILISSAKIPPSIAETITDGYYE